MTTPEGSTARDVRPEDEGIPEVAVDDSPTAQRAEDPELAALPGERANATVDFGTTAEEQASGESLSGRLAREVPDVGTDVGTAGDAQRATLQLEQDTEPGSDSGTGATVDDVEASGEAAVGGEGPEESAVHPLES